MKTIPRPDEQCFVIGPYREPVAHVRPGETFLIDTADAFGDRIRTGQEDLIEVCRDGGNPVTGPVYVEGAEPGDTLAVRIDRIQPTRTFAVSCLYPRFGGLVGPEWALEEPLPPRISIHPLRDGHLIFSDEITIPPIPLQPFFGTIGTAPRVAAVGAESSGPHGGNMDVADAGVGNTVFLPVQVTGAHLYVGDVHAVQGDGEICGAGLEVPARSTLTATVIKDQTLAWPRVESDDYIMAIGNARPLEDATRIAFAELVRWMAADYGIDPLDAYQLCTTVAEARLGNVVDPQYSMVAKFPKRFLPKEEANLPRTRNQRQCTR